MGGMAGTLGSMATDVGTGIAAGESAVATDFAGKITDIPGNIANGAKNIANTAGEFVDIVSGKSKLAGDWMANTVDPALNIAKTVDDKALGGLGQKAINGVSDIGSQLYKNVSKDLEDEWNSVKETNADGSTNYWRTGSNIGYGLAKTALVSSISGGGSKSKQQDNSSAQAQAVQAPQAETEAPNAEDELNKLMKNGQQF